MHRLQIFCGTPAYMSPEICAKSSYDGPSCDIWAAGVILFTILFGYQPFKAPSEKELYKKIIKGNFVMPSTSQIPCEGKIFSDSQCESPSTKQSQRRESPLKKTMFQQHVGNNKKSVFKTEVFDNYPLIQNASAIKSLIHDMLNPKETKRASAKQIQEKYMDWLSGHFWPIIYFQL